MSPPEAYRAGFFLKCASLGLSADVATVLYRQPEAMLKSAAGNPPNATAQLLASLRSGAGAAVAAPARFGMAAGAAGKGLAESMNAEAQARKQVGLSPAALRDFLLAAHYDRASKALMPAAPAA